MSSFSVFFGDSESFYVILCISGTFSVNLLIYVFSGPLSSLGSRGPSRALPDLHTAPNMWILHFRSHSWYFSIFRTNLHIFRCFMLFWAFLVSFSIFPYFMAFWSKTRKGTQKLLKYRYHCICFVISGFWRKYSEPWVFLRMINVVESIFAILRFPVSRNCWKCYNYIFKIIVQIDFRPTACEDRSK